MIPTLAIATLTLSAASDEYKYAPEEDLDDLLRIWLKKAFCLEREEVLWGLITLYESSPGAKEGVGPTRFLPFARRVIRSLLENEKATSEQIEWFVHALLGVGHGQNIYFHAEIWQAIREETRAWLVSTESRLANEARDLDHLKDLLEEVLEQEDRASPAFGYASGHLRFLVSANPEVWRDLHLPADSELCVLKHFGDEEISIKRSSIGSHQRLLSWDKRRILVLNTNGPCYLETLPLKSRR